MDLAAVLLAVAAVVGVVYVILDMVRFRRDMQRWKAEDAAFKRMIEQWRRERREDES